MGQLTYTPVDTGKLTHLLNQRGVNSINALSRDMGRSSSYIQKQLLVYKGISKPVEVYLQVRYNIKPEDYKPDPQPEPMPAPASPAPEWMDADKLFGIIYKAAYAAAKEATKPPAPVRQELCAKCYHKTLCTSFICRVAGGLDNRVRCDACGKEDFGATYEIMPRR